MATFECQCPKCGTAFSASDHQIGKVHSCSECYSECIIPSQRVDPGTVFGGYTVLYPLGLGQTGEMHLAKKDGCRVALKVLFHDGLDGDDVVKRFLREAEITNSLDHEVIARTIDAGRAGDQVYAVMEYIEGNTLDQHLDNFGEACEHDALRVVRDVADAMSCVWDEFRLVHRNITLTNIMVAYSGDTKLLDLGIAKAFAYDVTQLTDPEGVLGSPPYMSPEQCVPRGQRSLDFRSDIYSLGCVLYQLVANEYAFLGETPLSTMRRQLLEKHRDPREYVPDISDGLVALLDKMLAKQPAKRHSSWFELIEQMEVLID